MDIDTFVQNVKEYCARKGVKPTVACTESGAGKDMLTNAAKRGIVPSVAKVQLLAQYLGCTVSDLLGENAPESTPQQAVVDEFARIFAQLSPQDQTELGAEVLRRLRQKEQ